ncbi:hypothetical protein PR202_gb25593 [Eleusine coracana subsp. coracana]|uniref:Mitochondrial pyruvate carrier n=1 Tax=Eleusine coracana subsp. coracana TaxID=191504 RepID=A0AAV5FR10_ELECO|nr:hypothetical protein PR202_gb25593 [Eleusine coracana subsp. coracana]
MATSKLQALWNHPAGPKTNVFLLCIFTDMHSLNMHTTFDLNLTIFAVHFWAPTFKWGISIANIADFAKPPEKISYPQQIAVTATGLIWSRYSLVITPVSHPYFHVLYMNQNIYGHLNLIYCLFVDLQCLVLLQKNWNLFSVNVAMASTGLYQLSRKIRQDYFSDEKEATAQLEG